MHLFICFSIWTMVVSLMIWRSYKTVKEAISYLKRLHKIPCANCLYFTGEYSLKCTVNPSNAFSEQALDCRDFELCASRQKYFFEEDMRKKYCSCSNLSSKN